MEDNNENGSVKRFKSFTLSPKLDQQVLLLDSAATSENGKQSLLRPTQALFVV